MRLCPQTETQSVYQHGCSVKEHIFDLISYLKTGKIDEGWRLPIWMETYREQLLSALLPEDVIEEYTIFHDCSKPYCITIDADGRRHFPNHAEKSGEKWLEIGGSEQVTKLMKMDMCIHTMKAADIDEFITHPEAITLLLAGLAEVHSNAKMFGGLDSESFKIKWSQINKRGKMICQKLFKNEL
ncbi:MAG TPA: hypothetical protein VII94_00870 [Candidatus Saccharimonadales bacterium]